MHKMQRSLLQPMVLSSAIILLNIMNPAQYNYVVVQM